MTQPPTGDALDLLVFELAGARYALELACVREVLRAVFITPLPDAPPVVEGVVDIRGEIVPVYDLRARFDLPARALTPDEVLIAAWTGERRVAIRAETVEWMAQVPVTAVSDPSGFRLGSRRIKGVLQLEDGLVLIQDLAAFLDQAEADSLGRALAGVARDVD